MTARLEMDLDEVRAFIRAGSLNDKIYIGCDSAIKKNRAGKWVADYISVVVIHKGGKHGCKIFGHLETEPDYATDKRKPIMRLLNEAMKAAILYDKIKDSIGVRYREIHLDINPDERFNSHAALSQAVGYIRGMCGLIAVVKPDAFAAQYAADRFVRVKNYDIARAEPLVESNGRRRKFAKRKAA